jgi:hypothetical protein
LAEHQTGKRRVVVARRQRHGRTLAFVTKHEADGVYYATMVDETARLHADEASHWDALHARFEAYRISHSEAYSANGICTNQVEGCFQPVAPDGVQPAPPRFAAVSLPVRQSGGMA